jgi:hypothetical protein
MKFRRSRPAVTFGETQFKEVSILYAVTYKGIPRSKYTYRDGRNPAYRLLFSETESKCEWIAARLNKKHNTTGFKVIRIYWTEKDII